MPNPLHRLNLHAATARAEQRVAERYGYLQRLLSAPVSLLLDDEPGHALRALPSVDRPALVVTANRSPHYLRDLLDEEPEGLLVCPSLPSALHPYLLRVAAGERFYEGPPPYKTPLTRREREVLRRTMYGESAEALAPLLGISAYTVGEHLRHVRTKLGVERNAELVLAYFAGDAVRLAV